MPKKTRTPTFGVLVGVLAETLVHQYERAPVVAVTYAPAERLVQRAVRLDLVPVVAAQQTT